jgi:hypothetical protein
MPHRAVAELVAEPTSGDDPAEPREPEAGRGDEPVPADVPSPEEAAAELEEAGSRRYPSTIGGAFYLGILLVTAIGIVIVWTGDWRLGIRWVAGALIAACALRAVLPRKDAGMLAVRHRLLDCLFLAGVAAALIFLASTIPNQPV